MNKCLVGIDTSCYTTSVAVMDEQGNLLADVRRLLQVKPGGRGLSQSEMVFQHVRNLPEVFSDALAMLAPTVCLAGIGVSAFPRTLPDSYMPAFVVGEGYARVLAASHGMPLWRISHQQNHILAGKWSAGGPAVPAFLALHLSGGTSEIVLVNDTDKMEVKLLGASRDLHAGQLVDRVGVALKLPFPAGPSLEQLAQSGHAEPVKLAVAVNGMDMSFSGPETQALRLIERGASASAVAAGVEDCIAVTIAAVIGNAVQETGIRHVLLVGGVMSNQYIREKTANRLAAINVKPYFPAKQYSPDNAVGAAFFAMSCFCCK